MAADIITRSDEALRTDGNGITPDMGRRFIQFLDAKPQTAKAYGEGVALLFGWLGMRGITRPTRSALVAWKKDMATLPREALAGWEYPEGVAGSPLKPATVNLYMAAAKRLFAWLASEGLYRDIADGMKGLKTTRDHKRDYLNGGGVRDILDTADRDTIQGKRDYAIIALMATCGLRVSEVVKANVGDLREVACGESSSPALFIQGKGRNEKDNFVKVPMEAHAAILEYLAARGHQAPAEPLFQAAGNRRADGGRLTARSLSRLVKGHLTAGGHGGPSMTAHSLRHTAATLALRGGESLIDVQSMLRHSDPATTMIYLHALNKEASTATATAAKAIFA